MQEHKKMYGFHSQDVHVDFYVEGQVYRMRSVYLKSPTYSVVNNHIMGFIQCEDPADGPQYLDVTLQDVPTRIVIRGICECGDMDLCLNCL